MADHQGWWRAVNMGRNRRGGISSLATLAASDPETPMLVALSPPYLGAVAGDLEEARLALQDPELLSIVSAGTSGPRYNLPVLPADARLRGCLGGSLMSLNARIARWIICQTDPEDPAAWKYPALEGSLDELLSEQTPLQPRRGVGQSDLQVSEFIRSRFRGVNDRRALPAASPLHAAFRERGLACEQRRFRLLYEQVMEEWIGTSEESVSV